MTCLGRGWRLFIGNHVFDNPLPLPASKTALVTSENNILHLELIGNGGGVMDEGPNLGLVKKWSGRIVETRYSNVDLEEKDTRCVL